VTVGSVEGDWNILKDKFCHHYFHEKKIFALRVEVLTFKQREEESLGAAWACYTKLISLGPNLRIPEAMQLQHFSYGLRTDSMTYLDKASRGSFLYKIVSDAKTILNRILQNTEYTGVYEDPPEKSREPTRRAEPSTQSPTPCPQKISEPNFSTSNPEPFIENHRPFFLSMFDDHESIMYGDVSSSPKEESDADGESEVVTSDPEEESLSETDQARGGLSNPGQRDCL